MDECESEGYEDIRSMTRCGGIISSSSGSGRSEDGESGDGEWSDDISRKEVGGRGCRQWKSSCLYLYRGGWGVMKQLGGVRKSDDGWSLNDVDLDRGWNKGVSTLLIKLLMPFLSGDEG